MLVFEVQLFGLFGLLLLLLYCLRVGHFASYNGAKFVVGCSRSHIPEFDKCGVDSQRICSGCCFDVRVLSQPLGSNVNLTDLALWLLEFKDLLAQEIRQDSIELLSVLPSLVDELDEPLHHWVDAVEVKSLNLEWLDSMRTSHLLQCITHLLRNLNLLADLHLVVVLHIDLEV